MRCCVTQCPSSDVWLSAFSLISLSVCILSSLWCSCLFISRFRVSVLPKSGACVNFVSVFFDCNVRDPVLVKTFLLNWCFPTQNTLFNVHWSQLQVTCKFVDRIVCEMGPHPSIHRLWTHLPDEMTGRCSQTIRPRLRTVLVVQRLRRLWCL